MSKIVVIAHDDNFKPNLLDFLKEKIMVFGREIVATGRTAEFLVKGELNLPLVHVNKGSDGGYLQIIEMIKNDEVSIVFFLEILQLCSLITMISYSYLILAIITIFL